MDNTGFCDVELYGFCERCDHPCPAYFEMERKYPMTTIPAITPEGTAYNLRIERANDGYMTIVAPNGNGVTIRRFRDGHVGIYLDTPYPDSDIKAVRAFHAALTEALAQVSGVAE